jgi:hypothetical protein
MSQTQPAAPSTGRIALALGIVGLILGASALGYAVYLGLSVVPSQISAVSVDQPCSTSAPCGGSTNIRVEWETKLNSGQDRFFPNYITVIQGNNVTITFITNDTSDGHSLELPLSVVGLPSSSLLILNNSWTGQTSGPYIGVSPTGTAVGVHPTPNGLDCCLANGSPYNPQDNFTGPPTGCTDHNGNALSCNTQNAGGSGYKCNAFTPIIQNNPNASTACNLWSSAYLGVVTTPGIYKFFCFYHQTAGMVGYLIVIPNKGFTS